MTAPAENSVKGRHPVLEWMPILIGLIALYVPTYVDLARTLWSTDEQGHGPIIAGLVFWFFWQKRFEVHDSPKRSSSWGWWWFVSGLLVFTIGRSQNILLFEVGSQIPIVVGVLLVTRGVAALRSVWFPVLFLIFMIPLPGPIIDTLTFPMKMAVSWAAEHVLFIMGYPIARTGVILQIGQYKLLVADACAGLHTLFTLEALGLLYLHMVRHESVFRNITLALFIVPISFSANTIRVISLTLITYYFGDEAGQGFLHGFAGMVLFMSALLLIFGMDSLLQIVDKRFFHRFPEAVAGK